MHCKAVGILNCDVIDINNLNLRTVFQLFVRIKKDLVERNNMYLENNTTTKMIFSRTDLHGDSLLVF